MSKWHHSSSSVFMTFTLQSLNKKTVSKLNESVYLWMDYELSYVNFLCIQSHNLVMIYWPHNCRSALTGRLLKEVIECYSADKLVIIKSDLTSHGSVFEGLLGKLLRFIFRGLPFCQARWQQAHCDVCLIFWWRQVINLQISINKNFTNTNHMSIIFDRGVKHSKQLHHGFNDFLNDDWLACSLFSSSSFGPMLNWPLLTRCTSVIQIRSISTSWNTLNFCWVIISIWGHLARCYTFRLFTDVSSYKAFQERSL